MQFSGWKDTLDVYDEEYAFNYFLYWSVSFPGLISFICRYLLKWITFQRSGTYVNLSRVDPTLVGVSSSEPLAYLTAPGVTHGYLVCVSLVYVQECSIRKPKPISQWYVKRVGGIMHTQELERLSGCLGMVFNFDDMDANMLGNLPLILCHCKPIYISLFIIRIYHVFYHQEGLRFFF